MSLNSASEFNSLGNGGFGGFGGFGGIAPVGLIGLTSFGDHHKRDKDDDCSTKMLLLKAIGDLKEAEKDSTLLTLAAIDRFKDNSVGEFRGIAKDICDTRHDIQKEICDTKTEVLKEVCDTKIEILKSQFETEKQITALSVKTDAQFAENAAEQFRQTAVILAKLNQDENQRLRDELFHAHRRSDSQDIDIKINNSNAQTQAQFQTQNNALFNALDRISGQVAKAENGIINVGGLVAAAQTATPTNTSVK